jgi:glucan biosynthesis protein C
MNTERRYDLDWLRVIAFGILIYFHTAIIFIPGGMPMIQNGENSAFLNAFVAISSQFRLALLFFISGVGIGFARKKRNRADFLKERSVRLLIPLAVGILMIVPPMVYIEKLHLGEISGSFLAFYPDFFTSGIYPRGNLSWHHFWFIAYLYLYCIFGLKAFEKLSELPNSSVITRWGKDWRIYGFILPLIIVELPLRAIFPGFPDLIHDWANFFHWYLILLAGFTVAHNAAMLDNAQHYRTVSLLIAICSSALLFALFYSDGRIHLDPCRPHVAALYITLCVVRMIMVWTSILSCVGYAARYLRRPSVVLSYLNEGIYPLFILHLTAMTAIGYFVVQWQMELWLKYLTITSLTIITILVLYQVAIKHFKVTRLMFGLRLK